MDNKCRKAKRTTNATLQFWNGNFFLITPCPDVCLLLGRRLLRVCGVFKFRLILIEVFLFLNRNKHPYFRHKLLESINVTLTSSSSRTKTCDQISFRKRPFDFYAGAGGGGGAGLEDVFGPGHFFSLATRSCLLYIIQYVR